MFWYVLLRCINSMFVFSFCKCQQHCPHGWRTYRIIGQDSSRGRDSSSTTDFQETKGHRGIKRPGQRSHHGFFYNGQENSKGRLFSQQLEAGCSGGRGWWCDRCSQRGPDRWCPSDYPFFATAEKDQGDPCYYSPSFQLASRLVKGVWYYRAVADSISLIVYWSSPYY